MPDRLTRLRARMAETGTDLCAIGPTSHMRWLLGLDPHGDERPVMLLVSPDHAGLLIPGLNADSARQATDVPFHTWTDADGPDAALAGLLDACGVRSGLHVAIDEAMRADFALRLIDALPPHRRSLTQDTVGALRLRKDDAEIAALRASARINDRAAMAGFAALRDGVTELDVQAAIHAVYKAEGATPLFTIVAFGPNSAFPHHHTGPTVLARDMAVLIDTGCLLKGYPSDMTRCGWFGTPDAAFLRVARIVEDAVQAAMAAVGPGVRARDIDRAARGVIADAGQRECFLHRTGHGLGIDIHEPPWITATSDSIIEDGNVFSIEPGIYLPGRFGIRLEDIVVVSGTGAEVLSGLPRTLILRD
jgi:Xaa-Pro dipeptidase